MANVKAEEGGDKPAHLNIKINSQDGDALEFKVKPSTKLEKIFNVYCEKKGLSLNQVRFLYDGAHLLKDQTVQAVNLEDGDAIDCVVSQIGGRRFAFPEGLQSCRAPEPLEHV